MIKRLRDEVLHSYLHDEVGARHMNKDGSYSPKSRRGRQRLPSLVPHPAHYFRSALN